MEMEVDGLRDDTMNNKSLAAVFVFVFCLIPFGASAFDDMQNITDMDEYYSMFDDVYSGEVDDEELSEVMDELSKPEISAKGDDQIEYAGSDYYSDEVIDIPEQQAMSEW